MADQRLAIYSKKGVLMDRIQATVNTTESLNDFGSCEFSISIRDPKATEANFTFGNYVLFEHARLGNWGGVIAPSSGMDWEDDKTISVRCLSAEYQFWRRRGPLHDVTSKIPGSIKGTYGQLMRKLIRYCNAEEDSLLRPRAIEMSGDDAMVKLRYAMVGDVLSHILKISGWDFWVTPYLDHGLLRFGVNFQPRRGRNRGYFLRERINMERPGGAHHRREVEMVNDVIVLTEGGDAPLKPYGKKISTASRAKYGLWQGVDAIEGDSQVGAQWRASQIISTQAFPWKKDKVIAIETPESQNTFSYIPVGDEVTIHKDSVKYYGSTIPYKRTARIVSREYRSDVKKCILTMEHDDE